MTPEKQQTPLQKLIDKLKKEEESCYAFGDYRKRDAYRYAIKAAESLLPKEKQMVIDAVNYGANEDPDLGEQYFNETFKQ